MDVTTHRLKKTYLMFGAESHVCLHSRAEVVCSSPSSLVSCREPMLRCLHDIFRWYFGMFCCRLHMHYQHIDILFIVCGSDDKLHPCRVFEDLLASAVADRGRVV